MFSLKVYFDYKSPYSFLAMEPAYQLERDFEIRLDFRPWCLDIKSFYGSVEARTPQQLFNVKYLYLDCRRLAARRNLTILAPRRIFDSSLAAVGALFAVEKGAFRIYNDAVFTRFWRHELDIGSLDEISQVIVSTGIGSAEDFKAFVEEGRARLNVLRLEAEVDRVFGIPLFVFPDGEPFFGQDRIPMVRERLTALGLARPV